MVHISALLVLEIPGIVVTGAILASTIKTVLLFFFLQSGFLTIVMKAVNKATEPVLLYQHSDVVCSMTNESNIRFQLLVTLKPIRITLLVFQIDIQSFGSRNNHFKICM